MKKFVSIVCVLVLALSFAACKKSADGNGSVPPSSAAEGIFFVGSDDAVAIGTPEKALDVKAVYEKLQYTEEMFLGRYCLPYWFDSKQGDSVMAKLRTDAGFMEDPFGETAAGGESEQLSTVPYKWEAGSKTMTIGLANDTAHRWVQLSFATEKGSADREFLYEVKGNKLLLTGVEWEWSNETKKLKYQLLEDVKLEYEFAFRGRELTLTKDGKSVTLYAGKDYSGSKDYLNANGYLSDGSATFDGVINLSFLWDEDANNRFYVTYTYTEENEEKEETVRKAIGKFDRDGLLTLTVPYSSGTKTYSFVYFLCDNDGVILTDGDNTYYYNLDYFEYMKHDLSKNIDVEQIDSVDALSESDLKAIEEKKADLFEDLAKAFTDAGIKVSVNRKTGELAMDSTVLFGGDSAEVSSDGKAFLNKFIKAYTDIIYNEKYNGFIAKTVVEGHAAPVNGITYEQALPFSEKRAKNVMKYCLSDETGVDTKALAETMETVGYSNSKPVLKDDGSIDYDASRRVSFRFIINLDN